MYVHSTNKIQLQAILFCLKLVVLPILDTYTETFLSENIRAAKAVQKSVTINNFNWAS